MKAKTPKVKEKVSEKSFERKETKKSPIPHFDPNESILLENNDIKKNFLKFLTPKEIKSSAFQNLLHPLVFTDDQVFQSLSVFCASMMTFIPRINKDSSGRNYEKICLILSSNTCMRLFGLLSHYCYWSIVHPRVKSIVTAFLSENVAIDGIEKHLSALENDCALMAALQQSDGHSLLSHASMTNKDKGKETIFVQVEESLLKLHKYIGFNKVALSTGHQALVGACHFVVDSVMSETYPWLGPPRYAATQGCGASAAPRAEAPDLLRLAIHEAIGEIVDPSGIYSASSCVECIVGKRTRRRAVGGRDPSHLYTTSTALRAALSDSAYSDTRRFLGLSQQRPSPPSRGSPLASSLPQLETAPPQESSGVDRKLAQSWSGRRSSLLPPPAVLCSSGSLAPIAPLDSSQPPRRRETKIDFRNLFPTNRPEPSVAGSCGAGSLSSGGGGGSPIMPQSQRAEVQISLEGKTSLFGLIVDRTAVGYSSKNVMSQYSRTPEARQRQQLITHM